MIINWEAENIVNDTTVNQRVYFLFKYLNKKEFDFGNKF